MDDAYIDALYEDMVSLYHLDQIDTTGSVQRDDLGPLPSTAVALLVTLGAAWVLIGVYYCYRTIKSKREN